MLNPNASDPVSVTIDDDPVDHLGKFKRPQELVRDARIIESRLRSLYITRDNAQTLLQEIENPNTAMRFAQSVLETLGRRCVVLDGGDVLATIEDKWTGNIRARTRCRLQERRSMLNSEFLISSTTPGSRSENSHI
jgi:hypothetical protein